MKTLATLEKLISCLRKFPGIGRRSAERIAIKLITERDSLLKELVDTLQGVGKNISCCSRCGGLTPFDEDPCRLCTDASRDSALLCVVEDPSDILLIETAGGYHGRYHALMGKISPMNQEGANDIRMEALMRRLDSEPIKEVILALNSDVESEATASFIHDMLAGRQIRISRPAMGLPAGSGIAYSDAVTLARAIKSREQL
ncbi:recombination mediator RecR [Verrucomicrobiota bacterium]